MAKRPQSGDVDIHFGRIFTYKNACIQKGKQFFDAQGTEPYRNWPNGRRVARSISTLTAYLLHKIRMRFTMISNGGRQISQPRGQARGRQTGQAPRHPGRQARRPGNQPGKQARR